MWTTITTTRSNVDDLNCHLLASGLIDTGFWTLDSGLWTLDFGYWILDTGLWTLDFGYWILDTGLWTLDSGYWQSHVDDFNYHKVGYGRP